MKVRMKVGLSGPAYTLSPGDERDFPDGEAIRLITAGYADPAPGGGIERTVRAPPAETRAPRRKPKAEG
ncbi:hypothetical protein ACUSIJ_24955 [Pseudochelatococcus sp. B33]